MGAQKGKICTCVIYCILNSISLLHAEGCDDRVLVPLIHMGWFIILWQPGTNCTTGSYGYSLQVYIAFQALLYCSSKSGHFLNSMGFNPPTESRAPGRSQHKCPDCCLLLPIHSSPAIILKKDELFPPPASHMHAWEQPRSLNVLSCSRSKHIFVAKRPSPSKQQKFRHSLDKSAQLKLINPLPLMYWEPEQELCLLRWWGRISIIIC